MGYIDTDQGIPEYKSSGWCSICLNYFDGYGNNAEPINHGECCDKCNQLVIIERLKQMWKNNSDESK